MEGDAENSRLMSGGMKKEQQKPDWGRFGLSEEQRMEAELQKKPTDSYQHHSDPSQHNELFQEDQSAQGKPWWQANFFISEPVLFGTWDGVFTSSMINIFGVIIFLRTGWMVGNAGIGLSILIILLTISVSLIAAMSAIGVCERCKMESGGVYFLLSHVLGARIGASVGVLYCFGQAVAVSLYAVGFGESISSLIHQDNPWVARGIASGVIILLLGINVAGVKWVIRLQLILLIILLVAVLDFLVGSFVHTDKDHGVIGYSTWNIRNNTGPDYTEGNSFFTVFGVFFPSATGVFAGINMSGDLRNPDRNIPVGTLSAVGVSTCLYMSFALVLGATCIRPVLQDDYMIAEKVSIVGVLFLAGLYISSISSSMGGLYGSPRILQCIANENVIPPIKVLGHGRGPNKVPVFALLVITTISLIFVFIGKVNTLGPIVTMPFMITYVLVDYAYFVLAMSFDKRKARDLRFKEARDLPPTFDKTVLNTNGNLGKAGYGAIPSKPDSEDLDKLFPERTQYDRPLKAPPSNSSSAVTSPGGDSRSEAQSMEGDDTAGLLGANSIRPTNTEIMRQPRSFYSILCNRWLSLIGALCSLVIMFSIMWIYALVCVFVALILYAYIGHVNPGVFPGIAEFSMYEWIRDGVNRCCRRGPIPQEQIVVTPNTPAMNTMAAQLTEDNEDFAGRGRYHQSEIVKGENFDDYESE